MTAITIRNARIVDPATGHDELGSLRVVDGFIDEIGDGIARDEDHIIDANGAILAPALIDLRACVEPAFTPRGETVDSLAQAAAAGGIGTLVIAPSAEFPIDTPETVTGLKSAARPSPVRIMMAGGATRSLAGEQLAEIGLMAECGAAFLSQGNASTANTSALRNLFNYASGFELWLACPARDPHLSDGTVATESEAAARKGLMTEPTVSERIAIDRLAALAELTGARLMIDRVSTAEGLEALGRARQRGIEICATASIANLTLNAVDADGMDPAYRLTPPLRSEDDRRALVAGVISGQIDAIVSDHCPMEMDRKAQPFAEAAPGSTSLETVLAAMLGLVHENELDLVDALRPLTSGPADLLGLNQGRLQEGAPADLVLIDGDAPWVFGAEQSRSARRNSAWQNRRFQGQVLMTMIDGGIVYNLRE
ncbi:dihydroorotase [Hyphobacterium sp. HN65]|uniref:Dihydroorotase n=1 Tax=Hyphobacterium lacteum TaxID=3116575 RepID=A0ABU7LMG9_9PROT|nr:dihydroorotase [Hyphobacterium sp. HN65]MEE2525123.1 dihydroorotase [Hyphobacterium sp. HN65]